MNKNFNQDEFAYFLRKFLEDLRENFIDQLKI